VTLVPFDVEHAFVATELEATFRQRSDIEPDRLNSLTGDLLIAAVARERNATVVTKNTRDFELFGGVPVEAYR